VRGTNKVIQRSAEAGGLKSKIALLEKLLQELGRDVLQAFPRIVTSLQFASFLSQSDLYIDTTSTPEFCDKYPIAGNNEIALEGLCRLL